MKKRVFALLAAVMMFAAAPAGVFAASPTATTSEKPASGQAAATAVEKASSPSDYAKATTASDGFKVEAVSDSTVEAAAVAVQNVVLNQLADIGGKLDNSSLKSAAGDSTKKVTASILSVVEVNAESAGKDADGNYEVTLNVSGIAAKDTIAVLHYNGSSWEVIKPSKVAAGAVTFKTKSLSPIGVVKLSVSSVKAAPKTGERVPAGVFVVLIGFAGAAVCWKKYEGKKNF